LATVVLLLTFPFMGNVGLVMVFLLLLVILYFSYLYYEESNLHGAFAKTVDALSESMELGSFNEKARDLIMELASIIKGSECVLYMFDYRAKKQLPLIAALHSMDTTNLLNLEEYSIDIGVNEEFMQRIGIIPGKLFEAKTSSLAQLKEVGKGLTTDRGFVATPIVGLNGVEGMLIVISELIYLNNNQAHSIVGVVGKQLSTKRINDSLFNRSEEHANRDSLTGLYNRRLFDSVIGQYVSEEKPFSLALFDIDWFKSVNDMYGHSVGDLVLKKIAEILKLNSKGVDYACRYGGEELCIIFDGLDTAVAYTVAERIREIVENISISTGSGKSVRVTISGGVASFPEDGRSATEILDAADRALYMECKQKGRNRIACAGKVVV
jgi:diguanylate cyclase (GGDEF)-like protein